MNRISPALLALTFALFSLMSLLSASPIWENNTAPLADGGTRVSEIGLRVTFQH